MELTNNMSLEEFGDVSRPDYDQQMTVYLTDEMHEFVKECEDISGFSEFCRNKVKKKMIEEADDEDLKRWAVKNL